jgi:hypothetical protein
MIAVMQHPTDAMQITAINGPDSATTTFFNAELDIQRKN